MYAIRSYYEHVQHPGREDPVERADGHLDQGKAQGRKGDLPFLQSKRGPTEGTYNKVRGNNVV